MPNPVVGGILTTLTSTLAGLDQSGGAQVAKITTSLKIERDPGRRRAGGGADGDEDRFAASRRRRRAAV